ncbi:MAG: peptidylprolyl isomerase, partial [Bacteroidota bacterium]|nr:peptidylprolyl isomerase [Bacteroidota bacterium]
MNNKLYSFLILTSILILSTLSGFAQQNNTLLTIGEEKISSEEFLCVYNKNNVNDEVLNKETLEEYLDLYINFKLKVKEAEAQGYDTIPALSKELAGYREQLAKPYLIDEEVNKQLMEEAFSRMQYDVRASHILIKVGESASAEDTLRAYQKIQNIRKKVLQGDSFAKLAVKYSEDPSAKDQEHRGQVRKGNKGDLGYFSAFDMVYPFETAAYSIEIGSVSRPVRTKFGYHLIYLADKKETLGKIKGAHILLLTNKATTAEDSAAIKTKIFEVYKKLENGESFAALAKEYSDDLATARKGGDLGWFGCNKYIPEFTEAAYTLKNEGDFSKPFLTVYGWHILSLIEKNDGIGSFEDNKDKIKQRIAKNDRANLSKISLVADIKKEYGFNINQEAAQEISSVVNNTVFDGSWKNESEKELTATVFEIGEATYSQKDFALFIEKNQKRVKPVQLDKFIEKQFIAFVEDKCIRYEDSQLERKYPAFKSLMQEYHDGILLFELTNDLIWEKAISDTIGLTKFHQEHKLNY